MCSESDCSFQIPWGHFLLSNGDRTDAPLTDVEGYHHKTKTSINLSNFPLNTKYNLFWSAGDKETPQSVLQREGRIIHFDFEKRKRKAALPPGITGYYPALLIAVADCQAALEEKIETKRLRIPSQKSLLVMAPCTRKGKKPQSETKNQRIKSEQKSLRISAKQRNTSNVLDSGPNKKLDGDSPKEQLVITKTVATVDAEKEELKSLPNVSSIVQENKLKESGVEGGEISKEDSLKEKARLLNVTSIFVTSGAGAAALKGNNVDGITEPPPKKPKLDSIECNPCVKKEEDSALAGSSGIKENLKNTLLNDKAVSISSDNSSEDDLFGDNGSSNSDVPKLVHEEVCRKLKEMTRNYDSLVKKNKHMKSQLNDELSVAKKERDYYKKRYQEMKIKLDSRNTSKLQEQFVELQTKYATVLDLNLKLQQDAANVTGKRDSANTITKMAQKLASSEKQSGINIMTSKKGTQSEDMDNSMNDILFPSPCKKNSHTDSLKGFTTPLKHSSPSPSCIEEFSDETELNSSHFHLSASDRKRVNETTPVSKKQTDDKKDSSTASLEVEQSPELIRTRMKLNNKFWAYLVLSVEKCMSKCEALTDNQIDTLLGEFKKKPGEKMDSKLIKKGCGLLWSRRELWNRSATGVQCPNNKSHDQRPECTPEKKEYLADLLRLRIHAEKRTGPLDYASMEKRASHIPKYISKKVSYLRRKPEPTEDDTNNDD